MQNLIGYEKKVLDNGFIKVIDIMGNDSSVVQAARISYAQGIKTPPQDRALIRYLMRHKHTSPFEMCEIKFHLKMPMCIGEQWLRHRTANVNKISGRYAVLDNDFFIPNVEDLARQSILHKQSRDEQLEHQEALKAQEIILQNSKNCYENYEKLLNLGVAREIARMTLPANVYTQFYWKIDLHNLMHFIHLRSGCGAQFEIQQYANVLEEIIKEWVPVCHEAFVDYRKECVTLSKETKKLVSRNNIPSAALGITEQAEFDELFPQ